MRRRDLSGHWFGRLFALRYVGSNNGAMWFCFCVCGGTNIVRAGQLISGTVQSCGCLHIDKSRERAARVFGKFWNRRRNDMFFDDDDTEIEPPDADSIAKELTNDLNRPKLCPWSL